MLVVEDGTGLPNANSYATVDFADAYFAERGLDQIRLIREQLSPTQSDVKIWHGDMLEKEAALIRGTDHIEAVFGYRFLSQPLTPTQALSFPREQWPNVPLRVMKACVEYAIHALYDDLLPHRETEYKETTAGKVIRKREKIGPIEEDISYSPEGAIMRTEVYTPKTYPQADLYLASFVKLDPVVDPTGVQKKIQWSSYTRA